MEFKDKAKALESHIKIVETQDDPDFWKNTEAETITRALKDQKLWDSSLSVIRDVYTTSWSIFFPNRARPGSIFFPISFFLLACFMLILTLSMALNWSTVH